MKASITLKSEALSLRKRFLLTACTLLLTACETPQRLTTEATQDMRRDGIDDLSPALAQMQRDDSQNPAMLAVQLGSQAWQERPASGKSCADCHKIESLRSAAARYPALAKDGSLDTLASRINQCRTEQQGQKAFTWESDTLVGLETYLAKQSRNANISIASEAQRSPHYVAGKALYEQRVGQLNLACKHCHDDLAGKRLSATAIPQAHPTNYPTYRLEWQATGSLQRRFRNCMTAVRAQPYAYGSQEFAQLELYLKVRAQGMAWTAPGVRP